MSIPLPLFTAADDADAALQLPESDPVVRWMLNPADEPSATVQAFLMERCAAILPDYPAHDAYAYVIALHRHAVYATEATHAALLAAEISPERYDAEDTLTGDVVQRAAEHSWLEQSNSGTADTGDRTYKRADGTVRGHTDPVVHGRDADGIHRTMHAAECLERAQLWAMAQGAELPALIGTDSYSWLNIVTFSPDALTTDQGVTFATRPEGSGDSIVGNGRKRRGHRARRATYDPRPVSMEYASWLDFLATGQRVTKHYRSSLLVTVATDRADDVVTRGPRVVRIARVANPAGDPRYITRYIVRDSITARRTGRDTVTGRDRWSFIGHGPAVKTASITRPDPVKPRGKVATALPITADDAPAILAASFDDPTMPNRYAVTRADGIIVTVTVEHAQRRYSVATKNADGTVKRERCRTIKATLKRVA